MAAPVHVLVIGDNSPDNVCGVYRTGMFMPYFSELGVEVRFAAPPVDDLHAVGLIDAERELLEGDSDFIRQQIGWADVVLFRRGYSTTFRCPHCDFRSVDVTHGRTHIQAAGHAVMVPHDWLVRPLLERLVRDPAALGGRALMYETDDDLLGIQKWNGAYGMYAPEAYFIRAAAASADLVTVTTPVLAGRFAEFNRNVRVIRNAIEPGWYEGTRRHADPGRTRILYYGSVARLRDYQVCRDGVDAVARANPDVRRVWLGAPSLGHLHERISAVADDVLPYVPGVAQFAKSLVEANPDIGVAPVVGDGFDRAKSELHWIEYSMAGAVTVASRTMQPGPYRIIEPGVDGLLARSKADWADALTRVVRSPGIGRGRSAQVSLRPPETTRRESIAAPDPTAVFAAYVAAQQLASQTPLLVNVDSGTLRLDGWVNVDAKAGADLSLDVMYGLPFPDASIDAIYAPRTIDRLADLAPLFVTEAARTLKRGGHLRVVVRDEQLVLKRIARLTVEGVVLAGEAGCLAEYDETALIDLLTRHGFTEAVRVDRDESDCAQLRGLERLRGGQLAEDWLIVDATR